MNFNEVRDIVPDNQLVYFDGIVDQSILGASKHIELIGDMIGSICKEGILDKKTSTEIIERIKTLTTFFYESRGQSSAAVRNAISIMTMNISDYSQLNTDDAVNKILTRKSVFFNSQIKAIEHIIQYSVSESSKFNNLMIYDYSSTVEKFLKKLSHDKVSRTIFIAESRVIDGGKPYVNSMLQNGYKVHFIPDCSILYFLERCDAVFMGAETFFADGTGFNTIGSDLVALSARSLKIPLYFLTPMIKLDINSIYGIKKSLVMNTIKDKVDFDLSGGNIDNIDFSTPELIGVTSEYIYAYITERGIIPAIQMYSPSLIYAQQIEKNI